MGKQRDIFELPRSVYTPCQENKEHFNTNYIVFSWKLRQLSNSTRTSSQRLMCGREVRANLSLLASQTESTTNSILMKQLELEGNTNQKVQCSKKFQRDHQMELWACGRIRGQSRLQYQVRMENGQLGRKHIDRLIELKERLKSN